MPHDIGLQSTVWKGSLSGAILAAYNERQRGPYLTSDIFQTNFKVQIGIFNWLIQFPSRDSSHWPCSVTQPVNSDHDLKLFPNIDMARSVFWLERMELTRPIPNLTVYGHKCTLSYNDDTAGPSGFSPASLWYQLTALILHGRLTALAELDLRRV
jgi:hypothetical protein